MQSIIDILHKNFQEDNTNSRGFPGVVDTLNQYMHILDTLPFHVSVIRPILILAKKKIINCESNRKIICEVLVLPNKVIMQINVLTPRCC